MNYLVFLLLAGAVCGDAGLHHITEEEFCKMPQTVKDKLWKCFEPKVPKPIIDNWTKCAKDIYGVSSPYQATLKMCADDGGIKHKMMEECCEKTRGELSDGEIIKIVTDCIRPLNG